MGLTGVLCLLFNNGRTVVLARLIPYLEALGKDSLNKLIQIVGQIYVLRVVELRFPILCYLLFLAPKYYPHSLAYGPLLSSQPKGSIKFPVCSKSLTSTDSEKTLTLKIRVNRSDLPR